MEVGRRGVPTWLSGRERARSRSGTVPRRRSTYPPRRVPCPRMSPLSLIGDACIVAGFALGIAALALISLPLALGVAGLVLFVGGLGLTILARGRPSKLPPNAHGPFEPGTARSE